MSLISLIDFSGNTSFKLHLTSFNLYLNILCNKNDKESDKKYIPLKGMIEIILIKGYVIKKISKCNYQSFNDNANLMFSSRSFPFKFFPITTPS